MSLINGDENANVLNGTLGADEINGLGGDDQLYGYAGNDTLNGGEGSDDILEGGAGDDSLDGGGGSYNFAAYWNAPGPVTVDLGGGAASGADGNDVLANIRGAFLSMYDDTGFGTAGNDYLGGGNGNDLLVGRAGNDDLEGEGGDDTLDGGDGIDNAVYRGASGDYQISWVDGVVTVTDTNLSNGNDGTDTLRNIEFVYIYNENKLIDLADFDPGTNDTIDLTGQNGGVAAGGEGDDTYIVDDPNDTPLEVAGQGVDTVQASVSWTLGPALEVLVLTGAADLSGVGNTLANSLTGNSGNNTLDGGAGADTLGGGDGDDRYLVDDIGDLVIEGAPAPAFAGRVRPDGSGANIDTVIAQISYTLRDNVENLELAGGTGTEAFGNALANKLNGNVAANLLQGKAGNDALDGGAGIDVAAFAGPAAGYTVVTNGATVTVTDTNAGDGDEGVDVLTGFEALRFADTVQALPGSTITQGNATAQIFNLGAGGAQAAAGGSGNDTYLVNASGDAAIELAGGGTDLVKSAVSWKLWENLENLELTGNLVVDGTGNNAANRLTGNSAANKLSGYGGGDTLEGGAGADTLAGGPGNDLFIVGTGDVLVERANEGTDTVQSTLSRTLAANFENLTLTGSGNLSGAGNAVANALTGNSGANTLSGLDGADTLAGGGGNDVLKGGAGNDKLTGGAGADAFVFETALNAGTNKDTVVDFLAGSDKLRLDDDVFTQLGATGVLAAVKFHGGAGVTAAHDADDRLIYNNTTGVLYYDPDGTGGKAAVAFAVLGTTVHAGITAADFVIVG